MKINILKKNENFVFNATDSEGLNWIIHFDPFNEKDYEREKGIYISIELGSPLSLRYLFGCRKYDAEATPQCPVVGLFVAKNENLKKHMYVDFVHIFSDERPKSAKILLWNETLKKKLQTKKIN